MKILVPVGISLLLFLAACSGLSTFSSEKQETEYVSHGLTEMTNGHYESAERLFNQALQINEKNPYALLNLGLLCHARQRYVEARQYYQAVIDLNANEAADPRFVKGYKGKKLIEIARTNIDKVPQIAFATVEDVNQRDTDSDGVPDNLDRCPNTPAEAAVSINGCWSLVGIFSSGEAVIGSHAYDQLDAVIRILSKDPSLRIEIQGHTDDTGPADLNKQLSKKRAQSVMLYLIRKGISSKRLRWVGYGHTRPIASNNTEEGRNHNRRIELMPIR